MSDAKLKVYRQRIANLDDYDTLDELELDVFLVLMARDDLHLAKLSPDEQRELDRLDHQLRAHSDVISSFLPGPNQPGRAYWWWYLHEDRQPVDA